LPAPTTLAGSTATNPSVLPIRVDVLEEPQETVLVPFPEQLPQMPEGREALEAILILGVVLLVLGGATILGSLY
jgi:hypothetical protein